MKKIFKLLMLSILLVASGVGGVTTWAQADDTFTYAISGDPLSINPITTSDRWGLTTTNMIFSPLIRVEGDGSHKFELAEDIQVSEDGLTITVKLKEGVTWSDGEPFTAEDVVFTYETKADKANGNADKLWVGDQPIEVVAVDDHTVEFKLPEVNAAAVNNIATETYIIPKHIYENEPDFSVNELRASPVGTGPYRLKEYRQGEYLAFEANESYYGGKPKIKNIVFRIIANADTAKVALQKGEVDASIIMPADIADYENQPMNIHTYSENRVGYIGVNTNTLDDVKVRQAIFAALNRDEMNLAAYLDPEYYHNAYSFLPPQNPYYTEDVNKHEGGAEKAKELLQEAGVDGLKITLGYTANDPVQTMVATLAQQQLLQAGIDLELKGMDGAALYAETSKPDQTSLDLFIGGYIMGTDPDFYTPLFTSNGAYNTFKYANEQVDELFEAGAKEIDDSKRKEIYHELQQVLMDDAVIYPLVDNLKVFAVNERIDGIEDACFVPIYTMEDMSKLFIK